MNTEKFIKNGYEFTVVEVPVRGQAEKKDAFGKRVTFMMPKPNFDGKPNMALQSVRRLTRAEVMIIKIKSDILKQIEDGTY